MNTAVVGTCADNWAARPLEQQSLLQALLDPACYDHQTGAIELIETHISWVLLTGVYAYKIKKPLRLAFLDFSTLERRRFCCNEELRLNHRTAPDLYLRVVEITNSPGGLRINGHGPVVEYAVKMLQFSQRQRLDSVLADGRLERRHLRRLAVDVARLHRQASVAGVNSGYASSVGLREDTLQNFTALTGFGDTELDLPALAGRLRDWSAARHRQLEADFDLRRQQGFIRECHGDLHLENLVLHQDRVLAFDCIEFNVDLRWTDVISDVAFLIMDLDYRRRPDLGREFLNSYLEQTGDYAALKLLRFYQVYRAMVRAKVALIRLRQANLLPRRFAFLRNKVIGHLRLAGHYTDENPARGGPSEALIITHGLSGSGKSWLAGELALNTGAIRIRSDVERKRCNREDPYSQAATHKTYQRLLELAEIIIAAGYSVIVDATFLCRGQRRDFQNLARRLGAPFLILHTHADAQILEQRIRTRRNDPSDATLEVLARQRVDQEPLDDDEAGAVVSVETDRGEHVEAIASRVRHRLAAESS